MGTLTMWCVAREEGRHAYSLKCSCGKSSHEILIDDEVGARAAMDSLVAGWGKEHRCAPEGEGRHCPECGAVLEE